MRILLIALPLLAVAAAQPPKSIKPSDLDRLKAACPYTPSSDRQAGKLWRLDQAPPGNAYKAVFRSDDQSCVKPWIASDKIRSRGR